MKIKIELLLLLIAPLLPAFPVISADVPLWSGTDRWLLVARNYKGDAIEVDLDSIHGNRFRYFWDKIWFATKEDRERTKAKGYARYISIDCWDKIARLRTSETLVDMEIGTTKNDGDNGVLVQTVPGSSLGNEVDFVCAQ